MLKMKKEKGFTLVEAIVALLIGSLMLMAIYGAIDSAQRSATKIEKRVVGQQDVRGAVELMALEIQMASYNPRLLRNIWTDSTSCSGTAANVNFRGIQVAEANRMIIEMDINDNGVIDGTTSNPNEIIKYTYDTSNQYISRTTNCAPTDLPFLGDVATNVDGKTVLVVNDAANVPVFRYYDGHGAEIAAPVTVSIPDIRRVDIAVIVDTYSQDADTNKRKRIIYSNSVVIRNHSANYY